MRYLSLTRAALSLLVPALSVVYSSAATKIYDEVNGVVVIEAEHFTSRNNDPDGHHWHIVPEEDGNDAPYNDTHNTDYANARGSYIVALPDGGANHNSANLVGGTPNVEYKVNINSPGTYQLYLRWGGFDGSSDSIYAQILEISSPAWYRYGDGSNPDDADFVTVTQPSASATGWDGIANPGDVGGGGGEVPATFDLAGGVYTIRVSMREDGAALDALILQKSNLPPPANPGPAESPQASSYIAVTQPPQNASTTVGKTATFTVTVEGTGTFTYQWQSKAPGAANFTDIAGATTSSYTTPAATDAMNGTQYRVVISNGTKNVTSAPATLITDSTPPTLKQVNGGAGQTSVSLVFSEKLDKTSAENTANYTINGLSVTGAKLDATGTTVVLTTAKQTAGTTYTVSANGVKDAAGNAAANLSGSFVGATIVPNKILVRFYKNIGGTAVANLTSDPKYPNSPDEVALWDTFSSGDGTGDTFGDNYGAEITGFITPPTTGNYKFYIRSDDASQLLLSTDDTEGGLRQIAAQGGCCNAFTDAPGSLSSFPIQLTGGKPYYFKAYLKEGGGGDFIQVGMLGPNDPDINDASAVVPIPADYLSTGFSKTATLAVTQQPANLTVGANSSATFTVGYSANSVMGSSATVQWQRAAAGSSTFTDIAGATNKSYTIPFASAADNGAKFRAVLNINPPDPLFGTPVSATSDAATLTVSSDTTPPTVTGVSGGVTKIVVSFSEPLDSASATAAANYKLSGSATVTGAKVISGAGEAGQVELALSGITPGNSYTVTITGVKDSAGNAVASTTKSFEAFHIISDFDTGLPAGAVIVGNASIKPTGSYNGTGMLQLTDPAGSQQGSIVFPDQLNGADVTKFTATFKLFIGQGSGNPADGFSFNIASDIAPDITAPASFGEEGTGSGLIVSFDTYDNGGGEAPAITLKWAGTEFATTNVTKATLVNNQWVDVAIVVKDGKITVQHNNIKYYDNLPIDGWAPIAGAQVGLGARTGGESETHRVDDLKVLFNADIALPQPPTISITSPTPNQQIPANAPFTITVNAQDPEGQIAKVEFFANGVKLGESTTAPYSFTIPSVPQGAYFVTAKVTDGQGLSVTSAAVKAVAGNPDKILYVHSSGGPNATDNEVINHLFSLGYDVVTIGASTSTTEDANGKALVVISSTVSSGEVADKFLSVATPVLNWENALQDNMQFTTDEPTAHGTTTGQTELEIVNSTHPITAGLSGVITIADSPVELSWGMPGGEVTTLAKLNDGTGHFGLYAYDKGAKLNDGTPAAGRRVHFPGTDASYSSLNANGKKLFDNAIAWAAGKSGGGGGEQPVITVTKSDATHMSISWTGGGTLQSTTSLSAPINWTAAGAASPVTVETTGPAKFFRVVR